MALYETLAAKPPVMEYTIKINGIDIALGSNTTVSFKPPYNTVTVELKATANAPKYVEGRITSAAEEYGVGVGKLAYYDGSIPLNTVCTYTFYINSANFVHGDGQYRISLYAQSAIDGTWDVYEIFLTSQGENFTLNNGEGYEVLTEKEI